MRILHLTPGTGSFHCGSCLRDNALVKALRARGHDAMMVPLYLPLVTDADEANPEQAVRVGGVGLFLQQKFPWFRFMPRSLASDARPSGAAALGFAADGIDRRPRPRRNDRGQPAG